MQPNGSSPAGDVPQAFLTAIFFDERFNTIPAADGGVVQVQVAASVNGNSMPQLVLPADTKAPKNGYVYVYLSNQSNNNVYWDNFTVNLKHGQIVEENHYYAYGLKIATLSSKKLGDSYEGSLKNNYLYQGAYSELDDDISWHDFMMRNYDAQIGRWVQQDPFQQFASPYVGMGGDPVNLIDPSGGISVPTEEIKTLAEVVVSATRHSAKFTASFGNLLFKSLGLTSKVFQVSRIINSSFNSVQIGSSQNDCPDCPTGKLAEEKTLSEVIVHNSRYNDWSYKQMADAIDIGLLQGRTLEELELGLKQGYASIKTMEMFYDASDGASLAFRRNYQEIKDRQFDFEGGLAKFVSTTLFPYGRVFKGVGSGYKYFKAWRAARKAKKLLSKTVSAQKQARHLAGTAKKGSGYLNSMDDAQKVLDAVHSGEATLLGTTKTGHLIYKFEGVTGTNVNLGAGITGQPTNVFIIKGTTSPSVVPTSPFGVLK